MRISLRALSPSRRVRARPAGDRPEGVLVAARALPAPRRARCRYGSRRWTRTSSTASSGEKPALHRFPAGMAKRVQEHCAVIASEYGDDASRVWTYAKDGADLSRRRLESLPGFGEMKVLKFVRRCSLRSASGSRQRPSSFSFLPGTPCPGDVDSPACPDKLPGAETRLQGCSSEAAKTRLRGRRTDPEAVRADDAHAGRSGGVRCRPPALGLPRRCRAEPRSALYDVRFETDAGAPVPATLLSAHQRGVAVRLVYNVDHRARSPCRHHPDKARSDRGPARAHARHRRRSGPDASQVRGP